MTRKYTNQKSVYETLKRSDERFKRIKLLINELYEQEDGKVPVQVKQIRWSLNRMYKI